jgi:hypothetical protein
MQQPPENAGIFPRIEQALVALVKHDLDLLQSHVNERTLSQRLAFHLQEQFPSSQVDCEYNPDGMHAERANLQPESVGSDDLRGKSVYPDIIVHTRGGQGPNLLVMEITKGATEAERESALRKLIKIKEAYQFEGALFINFGSPEKPIEGIDWV